MEPIKSVVWSIGGEPFALINVHLCANFILIINGTIHEQKNKIHVLIYIALFF